MKIDKNKYNLARARACIGQKDFEAAGILRSTLSQAVRSDNPRPETIGRIARVLGVDVTDIIE